MKLVEDDPKSQTSHLMSICVMRSMLRLRPNLHHAIPLLYPFTDLLVLVLQQAQRIRRVIPLPLVRAPVKSRGELLGKVLGVFVLHGCISTGSMQFA